MNWIKKNLINLILVIIFLVGVGLLLYPTVADYWNSFHQSRAIASYAETVANMDDTDYEAMLSDAEEYNEELAKTGTQWNMSEAQLDEYNSVLNISGTGIMGYIEIEKINCSLPIYHGTDEGVLQIAIGHIEGTSLPVGGESTHCVLSGHRGLPSAKLFTDLDQMEIGDTFVIRTLDEVLTYEVDDIRIVLPNEIDTLGIEEGKDLCTLVTCTPYGVNTHRLLVTGHRVENAKTALNIRVTADADQMDTRIVASAVAIPILLILIILVLFTTRRNNQTYGRRAVPGKADHKKAARRSNRKPAAKRHKNPEKDLKKDQNTDLHKDLAEDQTENPAQAQDTEQPDELLDDLDLDLVLNQNTDPDKEWNKNQNTNQNTKPKAD